MAATYDWPLNLHDGNDTITVQFRAVPDGANVLDVGCATGTLLRELAARKGCTGLGIELDEEQAAIARERGVDVLTQDVTAPGAVARILEHTGGRRFDVIVFGDVLEHLTQPAQMLAVARDLLDPAGVVVASIPNVAHGSLRLELLRGSFRYHATGLLDHTHVQLFTRDSIHDLFERTGYDVDTWHRCYQPIFGCEGRVQEGELPAEVEKLVLADREAWVYQYVVVARPRPALVTVDPPQLPASPAPSQQLLVLPVGEVEDRWARALRRALAHDVDASLGPARADRRSALALLEQVAPDTLVLVVDTTVAPEARWIEPLLRAARAGGGPVGCGVVTPSGAVLHAGTTPAGVPVGSGGRWGEAPHLRADRASAGLLTPVCGRAADLLAHADAPAVPGRYLGTARAVTRRELPVPTGVAAGLDEVVGEGSVLVLLPCAPHRLEAPVRDAVETLVLRSVAAGRTPVLWWQATSLLDGREAAAHLERAGAVLFGGEPSVDAPPAQPELLVTQPAALSRALRPAAIVVLGVELARTDHALVSIGAPGSPTVLAWTPADDLTDAPAADVVLPVVDPSFPSRVLRVADDGLDVRPAAVPAIAARTRRPGHTTVVIPVWNRWDLTERCLDLLAEHTPEPYDVIVVDNGSTDLTATALPSRAAVDPRLQVVRNATNRGFAPAVNQGLELADGEFVCVLNNDVEVVPGWLTELLVGMERADTGGVGPRADEVSGLQRMANAPTLVDDPVAAHAHARAWAQHRPAHLWAVRRLVGLCLLLRGRALEAVGGFDESVGMGNFEDDELCNRLLAAGWRLLVAERSVVLHHGSATFDSAGLDYAGTMIEGARALARDGLAWAPSLTVLVLSDGDPAGVRRTVRDAFLVADTVLVVERRDPAALGGVLPGHVVYDQRVAGGDWTDPRVCTAVGTTVASNAVLVLEAGEGLVIRDLAAVRAALHDPDLPAVAVVTHDGPQVRLVPAGPDALTHIGPAPSTATVVPGLEIDRDTHG